MSYGVQIIADSVAPHGGRLTTFQLRFPRFLLAQFNTHRAISKNARSSRAVPVEKMIAEVESDPVVPIFWGANRKGMQATEELAGDELGRAQRHWLLARDEAITRAKSLVEIGAHKQLVNRILEPFMWADVVATATDWSNFFALRCHHAAQPEMQKLAVMMARAYRSGIPALLRSNWWHLPYTSPEERRLGSISDLIEFSVARCARVSYSPPDGSVGDPEKDRELARRLTADGHLSPLEHQGRPLPESRIRSGNFAGWEQYRQTVPISVHRDFDFGVLDHLAW